MCNCARCGRVRTEPVKCDNEEQKDKSRVNKSLNVSQSHSERTRAFMKEIRGRFQDTHLMPFLSIDMRGDRSPVVGFFPKI